MDEYVKNLRTATVGLVLLLALGLELVDERRRLHDAVLDIEEDLIALLLVRNGGRALVRDDLGVQAHFEAPKTPLIESSWHADNEANTAIFDNLRPKAISAYETFRRVGETYALGQARMRLVTRHEREIRLAGGITVYVEVPLQLSPSYDSFVNAYGEDTHTEWCEPQIATDAEGELEHIFFLPVDVQVSDERPSDILGTPTRYVVTNLRFDPSAGESGEGCVTAAREMRIGVITSDELPEFQSIYDLESNILAQGRQIGVVREDPQQVYIDARVRLQAGRVKLPVVGDEVTSAHALVAITWLGIALLAWSSYLLRSLALRGEADVTEPWGSFDVLAHWQESEWTHRLAVILEFALFTIFHLLAFAAPVLLACLLFGSLAAIDDSALPVRWPAMIIAIPLAWSALISYATLLGYSLAKRDKLSRVDAA